VGEKLKRSPMLLRIGVAWLVVVLTTCNVSTAVADSLTYNEWQQVSRLPKYISSVDSKEHSNCKLQYECSRCLEITEKPLDDLHHCTVGDGLKKCTTETQVITRNQDVKICTPTMVKVCPDTPCKTCPVFCQPLKQIWCEDDFKVMERVLTEKSCLDRHSIGFCSIVETSLDFVSTGRRCYEKMLEPVCATIDCKFDARDDEDCAHTTRPVNITLTQKVCKTCQPLGPEGSHRSEECTSQVASRPCANGFNGKWVKKCKVRSNNNENHREPRQHEDENEVLPISELFDMAASPVRKLLNTYNFENGGSSREIIDLETTTSTTTKRQAKDTYLEGGALSTSQPRHYKITSQKTPLSTKDLMVLNQRSMLVAKYQDATEIDEDANAADEQDNLVIVTSRTISDPESKK